MIVKLNEHEVSELLKHDGGPFGLGSFESFMAEVCARVDESTGELDMDRDDRERIAELKRRGHKRVLERVFQRAMDEAFGAFFGQGCNTDSRGPGRRPSGIRRRCRSR